MVNSAVPKIIAIIAGIMIAVGLAMFGFSVVKNAVNGVTAGAEQAIGSVTGGTFDLDGSSSGVTTSDGTAGLSGLGSGLSGANGTFNFGSGN